MQSNPNRPEPPPETPRITEATPSMKPVTQAIKTEPVIQDAPKMKAGLLMSQALQGQPQAKHDLMALAGDEKAEKLDREIAIRYLSNDGSLESLVIIAKQLISSDPQFRTTAYHCLPEDVRPPDFDYTAEPSVASREVVAKLIEKIRK